MPSIEITHDDLIRARRATVVLAECFMAANGGKKAPLALREDMLCLTRCLRALEPLTVADFQKKDAQR
jgi:hypothetical protein